MKTVYFVTLTLINVHIETKSNLIYFVNTIIDHNSVDFFLDQERTDVLKLNGEIPIPHLANLLANVVERTFICFSIITCRQSFDLAPTHYIEIVFDTWKHNAPGKVVHDSNPFAFLFFG